MLYAFNVLLGLTCPSGCQNARSEPRSSCFKAVTYLGIYRQSEYRQSIPNKSILQLIDNRLNNFVEFHTPCHASKDNSHINDGCYLVYWQRLGLEQDLISISDRYPCEIFWVAIMTSEHRVSPTYLIKTRATLAT